MLCGAVYFVVRLFPWIRRRVLWSLRNRLIVAYLFMAVVPVVLLVTMIGIATYLFLSATRRAPAATTPCRSAPT